MITVAPATSLLPARLQTRLRLTRRSVCAVRAPRSWMLLAPTSCCGGLNIYVLFFFKVCPEVIFGSHQWWVALGGS